MKTHYDNATGLPEDKTYLEKCLPQFLQRDIDALEKGKVEQPSYLDCLYNEVYGSINCAYYGDEITEEQANYLRQKYL